MAEDQGGGGSAAVATEMTTEQTIQQPSDAYTPEELRQLIREETTPALERLYQSVDRRITSVEQLRPQIEEVVGSARKTEAMVKRIFVGQATEDDVRNFEEADKLRLAEEARAKAEAQAKTLQESVMTSQQLAERDYVNAQQRIARVAARNGLSWGDIGDVALKLVVDRTASDPYGIVAWEEAAEKLVTDEADKRLKASQPVPRTPEARPVGAPEGTDSISLFKSGLEKRRK